MNIKYPSIENSYREKQLDWIRQVVPLTEQWEVTEKIHGANCFLYLTAEQDAEIQVGKRSGFVNPKKNFYGYKAWFESESILFKALFDDIFDYFDYDRLIQGIAIFGETFGGIYPHPDVPKIPNAQRVQKGVYYTPENAFYAFDIALCYKEETQLPYFLSTNLRNAFFEKHSIFYAKPLFQGSLGSCLNYNPNFLSTISDLFRLPSIPNNYAEGVVIKPIDNYYLNNGTRVILKNKTDRFKETQPRKKTKAVLADHLIPVFETLCQYITENRFNNIESHEGKSFEFKDFKDLRGLFIKDLMKDFFAENSTFDISDPDWRTVNQFLGKEINNNIRVWLKR